MIVFHDFSFYSLSFRELTSTFARLCHLSDDTNKNLKEEIESLEVAIRELEEIGNSARTLKNKASFLSSELDNFREVYLSGDDDLPPNL